MADYENPGEAPINDTTLAVAQRKRASLHRDWLVDLYQMIKVIGETMNQVVGGDNCVIGEDALRPRATTPLPDMRITVLLGTGFQDGLPFWKQANETSATLTAPPTGVDRIDLITIDCKEEDLTITTGVEDASPVAPSIPDGHYKVGEIYHRGGEVAIQNNDTSPNTDGYIKDMRSVVDNTYDESSGESGSGY